MQHVREKAVVEALNAGRLERGDIAGIQKLRRGIRQVNSYNFSSL